MIIKSVVLFLKCLTIFVLNRNFGNLVHDVAHKYNEQLDVADLRKLEKLHKKVEKVTLDITFLRNCDTFNVVPKFLCFNIPHSSWFEQKSIRRRLLKSAIRRREKEKLQLVNTLKHHEEFVRKTLTSIDMFLLRKCITQNVDKMVKESIKTHQKKLQDLTKNFSLPFNPDEVIKNLSSYKLSDEENDILKNGLSFAIPPMKVKKTDVFVSFEMIAKFMTQNLKNETHGNEVKSKLSYFANSYVHGYHPNGSSLKKHGILKKLRSRKDIVIVKPDKGNGVVVLNRVDYNNGLLEILNDESKFKLLNEDPTIKREGQLKRFLCKLNKNYKNFFSKSDYENIYPKGSVPARIYGLPKIHKQFSTVPPFRPVVSSIGTFNYHLARYLGSLLTPILPMEYAAKDTFTFVQELKEVSLRNKYMVSFDVCSLFTNIPLDETINIAVDLIFEKHQNFPLKRSELFKLFEFATLKTNFLFNGIMYDQIDGVAMGSPLAPILANLFMGSKEKDWIENCTFENHPFTEDL